MFYYIIGLIFLPTIINVMEKSNFKHIFYKNYDFVLKNEAEMSILP